MCLLMSWRRRNEKYGRGLVGMLSASFAGRAHVVIPSVLGTILLDVEATHHPQQPHSMLPAEAVCQMI